jgi:hypothetical protein
VIKSLLRRGRSEPMSASQAFDARRLRLSEPLGAPDTLWHTSSLLQVVVKVAQTTPFLNDGGLNLRRLVDATSALGALGCRGIDPEHLIHQGVGQSIKLALAASLGKLLGEADDPRSSWKHFDQWRSIFEGAVEERPSPRSYIQAVLEGPISQRLDSWIESASIEDLLLWRPPQTNTDSPKAHPTDSETEPWQWMVERFTKTYLREWSLASLKLEYSFVQGAWVPDFPMMLLTERTLTREEIATALADRAMVSADVIDPHTMGTFVDQALVLLADGQRTAAAAALFDAARTIKPLDLMAQNNYAFCILPDKPDQAKTLFHDILSRGVPDPSVTWCNLALAESLLGQTETALKACEQAYGAKGGHDGAYLWQRQDDEWVVSYINPRTWAIRFGAQLEESTGTTAAWAERLKTLTLPEPQEISADPSSIETNGEDL